MNIKFNKKNIVICAAVLSISILIIFIIRKTAYIGFTGGIIEVPEKSVYNSAPLRRNEIYIRDVLVEQFGKEFLDGLKLNEIKYIPLNTWMFSSYGDFHEYYYNHKKYGDFIITVNGDKGYSTYMETYDIDISGNDDIVKNKNNKVYLGINERLISGYLNNKENSNRNYIKKTKINDIMINDKIAFGKFANKNIVWTICDIKDDVLTLCSDYTFCFEENDIDRRMIDSRALNEHFTFDELKMICYTDDNLKFYADYPDNYNAFNDKDNRKVISSLWEWSSELLDRRDYLFGKNGKYKNTYIGCDENGDTYNAYNNMIPKRVFVNIKSDYVNKIIDYDNIDKLDFSEYKKSIYEFNDNKYQAFFRKHSLNDTSNIKKIRVSQVNDSIMNYNGKYVYIDKEGDEIEIIKYDKDTFKDLNVGDVVSLGQVYDEDYKRNFDLVFKIKKIEKDIAYLDALFSVTSSFSKKQYNEMIKYLNTDFLNTAFINEKGLVLIDFTSDELIDAYKKEKIIIANYAMLKDKYYYNEVVKVDDSNKKPLIDEYLYYDNEDIIKKNNDNQDFTLSIKVKMNKNVNEDTYIILPDIKMQNYYGRVIRIGSDLYYLDLYDTLNHIKSYNGEKIIDKKINTVIANNVKSIMTYNNDIYYLDKNNNFYELYNNEPKFIIDNVFCMINFNESGANFLVDVNEKYYLDTGLTAYYEKGVPFRYDKNDIYLIDNIEDGNRVKVSDVKLSNEIGDGTYHNIKYGAYVYVNNEDSLIMIDNNGRRQVIDKEVVNYLMLAGENGVVYNKIDGSDHVAYYYNYKDIKMIGKGIVDTGDDCYREVFALYDEYGKSIKEYINVPDEMKNHTYVSTKYSANEVQFMYKLIDEMDKITIRHSSLYYMEDEIIMVDDYLSNDYMSDHIEYYEGNGISYTKEEHNYTNKSIFEVYDITKKLSPFSINDPNLFMNEYRAIFSNKIRVNTDINELRNRININ